MSRPDLRIVDLPASTAKNDIVGMLDELRERASAGEFETMLIVAIRPDGSWQSKEGGGRKVHPLMVVGALESIKADLMESRKKDASE